MAEKQAKRRVERFFGVRLFLVTLTSLVLHSVPMARAEEPGSAQPRSYLVLGILNDGRLDASLREQLTQLIAREFGIARAPALVDSDLACRAKACLEQLPQKTGWPNYIVAGEVKQTTDATGILSWHLSVALYDVARQAAIQDESESSSPECISKTEPKATCGEPIRGHLLDELARRLLRKLGSGPLAEGEKYYTFSRGLAQGAFGGVAVAGLIAGAGVADVNGRQYTYTEADGRQRTFTPQLDSYSGASFGLMGVGLAGSVGSAVWGLWNKQGTSSRADRLRYLKGLLLGVSSSMLASSLIAASSLQGNEGSRCVEGNPNVVCTFYPGPAGLAWGMTGVWAAGFAVSIGLSLGLK